jgi:hypothetical protein
MRKIASYLNSEQSFEEFCSELYADSAKNNHLGKAAIARTKAHEAIADGKLDEAWGLLNEQKQHFLQHAAVCGFTKEQTLALDASVSEPMANILRLEGKHFDALIDIIYWVAATPRITKSQQQKLQSYFNRCKFKQVTPLQLNDLLDASRLNPDFMHIRDIVVDWRNRESA